MANNDNLKGHGFHERTAREQREIAIAGGRASGAARRRKADFRKTLNLLLTAEIDNPEWKPILESLGLECTLESAMLMGQIKAAMMGDSKAARFVAEYAGQSGKTDADHEEQRIRTERAKQARDQEVGTETGAEENIQNFLKAMRPTQDDLNNLFAEEQEVDDGEEAEATGAV